MPELPEVNAVVRNLRQELDLPRKEWQVKSVTILRQNGRYLCDPESDPIDKIRGTVIRDIRRRGKHIVFQMDDGIVVSHLAMSGYWDLEDRPWTFAYVEGAREPSGRDVRVEIRISPSGHDGGPGRTLRFHDARLFGSLRHLTDGVKDWNDAIELKVLGPEALVTPEVVSDAPRSVDLWEIVQGLSQKKRENLSIKELLMDQRVIAGVGNIYASEACWVAGIDPRRKLVTLTEMETKYLEADVGHVLEMAIVTGLDYSWLRVYRKEGEACSSCSGMIKRELVAGRATFWCEGHQR